MSTDDREIIAHYWERSETALRETMEKYGKYCHAIAYRILGSREDSEECVNDACMRAWDSIPPQRPDDLKAFLGKLTRNLALNRYQAASAQKRGGGQVPLALEELEECLSASDSPEQAAEAAGLTQELDRFLEGLDTDSRRIFLQRYWYFCTVKEIAKNLGMGESRVKMSLSRSRKKLKEQLTEGGFLS